MERKKIMGMIVGVMGVMMVTNSVECRLVKIGKSGWIPDYNYTQWLIQHPTHFYVGDWLYFMFDKHYFNVLEVNKTSYENCEDQGFMFNVTMGGRDVYQLKEARPYYFLSSGGYCWNGMKIAISAEDIPPSPAPAPPPKNASPSSSPAVIIFGALVWAIFLKPFHLVS